MNISGYYKYMTIQLLFHLLITLKVLGGSFKNLMKNILLDLTLVTILLRMM